MSFDETNFISKTGLKSPRSPRIEKEEEPKSVKKEPKQSVKASQRKQSQE